MPKPGKDPCKPYACRIQACLSGEYRFARVLRNFSTAIIIARLPSKTFAQLLKKNFKKQVSVLYLAYFQELTFSH